MRRILVVAFGVLFAAPLASSASHADSNYDSATLPNLGLGPAAAPASPSASYPNLGLGPTAASKSEGATATAPNLGLMPTISSPTPAKAATTAPPAPPPAATTEAATTAASTTPTETQNAAPSPAPQNSSFFQKVGQFFSGSRRESLPSIIHEVDAPAAANSNPLNLPYSLTIYFSNRSSLSQADAGVIGNKLGLTPNQISSACYLSTRGALTTTTGHYLINIGLSPQPKVYWDGGVKSFLLIAEALCLAGPNLPHNNNTLVQLNDRFVIPLQSITCPPPIPRARSLIITYNGTQNAQCTYQ
jgi:hypothetical protein